MVALSHQNNTQNIVYRVEHPVCLVTVQRSGIANNPDLTARAFLAAHRAKAEILVISQSSAAGSFSFVIHAQHMYALLDTLRAEFKADLSGGQSLNLHARTDIALLKAPSHPHTWAALSRANIGILLMGGGEGVTSLVVASRDAESALAQF
jgi:aspartokinase